jgi:hypothetical protein
MHSGLAHASPPWQSHVWCKESTQFQRRDSVHPFILGAPGKGFGTRKGSQLVTPGCYIPVILKLLQHHSQRFNPPMESGKNQGA